MTIQSEIILNKKLNGDVGITQNSVEVFSSINASAVVNTLYLKEGMVGIGVVPTIKLHVQVANTINKQALLIEQLDTTNNPICAEINNDGTNHGLYIHQDGVLAASKYSLYVYSNAIQNASPLAYFLQDNASSDQDLLVLKQDGTGNALNITAGKLKLPSGGAINEFSTDGTLAGNSDDAVPTEKAVKTYVDAIGLDTASVKDMFLNITLNAFRIAQVGSLTIFSMIKGFIDEYEDESGIDTVNSTNESYNSTDDYYSPVSVVDSYVKLLLHLDNNVTDSETTPKTVTNNNVTFSDTVKKFGYSGVFNGTTSYLTVPDSDDFDFGTGDFTIDFWVRFTTVQDTVFLTHYQDEPHRWYIMYINSTHRFVIYDAGGLNVSSASSTFTPIADTWYHIAIVRSSGVIRHYLDGNVLVLGTNLGAGNSIDTNTGLLYIGIYGDAITYPLNGYMDEVRVSKGIARWTSNFTPPTNPYGSELNMTLLSNSQVAESVPTSARLVLFEEDVDVITLNTDIKAYISRDNGVTYSQVTLEGEGTYITLARVLSGVVDISTQPSDTDIKYKIETFNNKNLKFHGTAVSWK